MWVHVVVAVTFKIGRRVLVAVIRAIYSGQYQRHGLTPGGILGPYVLIVIQAGAHIDSQERNDQTFVEAKVLLQNSDSFHLFLRLLMCWTFMGHLEGRALPVSPLTA